MRGNPLFNVDPLPGGPDHPASGRFDHKKHGMRKFSEDTSSSGVLYGLISFVQVTLHLSMMALTMSFRIDFLNWWNAGVSVSFLLAMVIMGAELIMWPLSYIPIQFFAKMFLVWSNVVMWHMTTSFWAGPILMLIAEIV